MISNIIENDISSHSNNILWLYNEDQPYYRLMTNIVFHNGIPDNIEERFNPQVSNLLIIDDLMTHCPSNEFILFSVRFDYRSERET